MPFRGKPAQAHAVNEEAPRFHTSGFSNKIASTKNAKEASVPAIVVRY